MGSQIEDEVLTRNPREAYGDHKLAKRPIPSPICSGVPMRRDGGPARMSITKITTLDQRLYAWLIQSDDRKFELAFNAYFSVAFPAVVRHLMRVSRWDANQLEELAQDALLKFFERVGRARRQASESVEQAVKQIRPLNFGAFHTRFVTRWSKDVTSFRDTSLAFRPTESDNPDDSDWKKVIRSLSEQIPVLQRQGYHIVNTVRVDLDWDAREDGNQSDATNELRMFAESLVGEIKAETERAHVAEVKHPGVGQFVGSALTIIDCLPRLRVPTNGFLFEIAINIYLDECKKRGRQKRGGSDNRASEAPAAAHESENASQHPMDMINLGVELIRENVTPVEGAARSSLCEAHSEFSAASVDPTIQYENEDLFEKFYMYLRKPLTDAIEANQAAQHGNSTNMERKKAETLAAKFDRMTAVLALMGEGHTQEETAEQLNLSRNQVKYIMEAVQASYLRFAAASTPRRSSTKSPRRIQ
jgi:DNA-directed RNA polymerase specialized sigma24 family protein